MSKSPRGLFEHFEASILGYAPVGVATVILAMRSDTLLTSNVLLFLIFLVCWRTANIVNKSTATN